eukprot:TRINITY_DN79586_c0_g1_i1.p1 TRINITY_DN79586_c0_g1~~TRINITY_DN79586_c0_g1_i1.p1  ORF type:complete len:240 (+),score=59.48 TRINITY_DN79586_c0_g1_i1:69-788(+)
MFKQFEAARAANNATRRKWQRAKELAKAHTKASKRQAALGETECETLTAYPDEDPRRFLWRFGYFRGPPTPELSVTVEGHEEEGSHTMYMLTCSLRSWQDPTGVPREIEWKCKKRLLQLREELHDKIKEDMADAYTERFQDTPFARYGGLPGTTARLKAWLVTLTGIANKGKLPTQLLLLLLQFLQVPVPKESDKELDALKPPLPEDSRRGSRFEGGRSSLGQAPSIPDDDGQIDWLTL